MMHAIEALDDMYNFCHIVKFTARAKFISEMYNYNEQSLILTSS